MPETPLGRFVWYELSTPDPDAGREFYSRVFGWGVQVHEGLEEPYPMFTVGDVPMGGVVKMPDAALREGAVPSWLGYVTTPNVDDTVTRALDLRATTLVGAQDIGDIGRMAVISDPQGASIALYTPQKPPEADPEPSPGYVSWRELATTGYEAASGFYAELFGWEVMEDHDMGDLGIYRIFGDGERQGGGIYDKPPEMRAAWLYYVRLEDLEAALERVVTGGGQVLHGPMEVPGGSRIAQCKDPQGGMFGMGE